ncbi:MAG: flagellin [Ruminococcus sp.]|jgi:flagellin|nr:flagellin [Ruminococcus sp.]
MEMNKNKIQVAFNEKALQSTIKNKPMGTERLSSGYKINNAADNAAGLAVSEMMKKQTKAIAKASADAENGISCLQTAEGYLIEINNMLGRCAELSLKSANDEIPKNEAESEFCALKEEIDRIIKTASFNDLKLFDGSNVFEFQIGETSSTESKIVIDRIDIQTLGFNNLSLLTTEGASEAVTAIRLAADKVSALRAKLGKYQNRLSHIIQNLSTTNENITEASSRIRDTDIAKEQASFIKNQVLQQAASALLQKSDESENNVLKLLS